MKRTILASAAALVLAGGTAFAQAKPNFAGKWTILPDSATVALQGMSPGGGEAGGLGGEATITQDEKTMTVKRMTPTMGELVSVFNLDGTETYATVNVQGNQIPLTMKTRWDAKKLVTSTWVNVGTGQSLEIILNFSLDDKGNLVTEHTVPSFGNGMPSGTIVSKYKKAP
jgi:hypothetical protein